MDVKTITAENLIECWKEIFPDVLLVAEDMKKPHALMSALFLLFDRLGIDKDAILAPPPEEERNENLYFYWDLLPVINTTRAFNHITQFAFTNTITQLLQPTHATSHTMLLLLFNLMLFREERMADIAPYEEELFSKTDKVRMLTDKKNNCLELLNKQFAEKAERAGRLKNIDREIKQYEEELKQEKEEEDKDKQELEALQKEYRQMHILLEQKKGLRDSLVTEVDKKRALRVYDAEDIKAQVEQATQNVQDAEEKLNMLQATLMQKETSLKNLQSIKPNLDSANVLLYDIINLTDSLRDCENEDTENKEDEQEKLNVELSELEAQFAELSAARVEAGRKRQEAGRKRQEERAQAKSDLRDAEEKDKKSAEKSIRDAQKVVELQELTEQYEKEKAAELDELASIKENFIHELESIDEAVLKKLAECKERIEAKIRKRHG
ncbi:DNA ligase 1-like [Maniola jurtina]|uniref:DNA ligase 1-like n=1 Tax=Maniola jurtina TaxID=191418 RepID=UPI001E68D095|nr:DNA ligase 1-like [Maniola jurtina]